MDKRIKIALEIMRHSSAVGLTVADVAAKVGLSSSRFEHILKTATGRTFPATQTQWTHRASKDTSSKLALVVEGDCLSHRLLLAIEFLARVPCLGFSIAVTVSNCWCRPGGAAGHLTRQQVKAKRSRFGQAILVGAEAAAPYIDALEDPGMLSADTSSPEGATYCSHCAERSDQVLATRICENRRWANRVIELSN